MNPKPDIAPPVAVSAEDVPAEKERLRRRRSRSIALAVILASLVILFYVITILKLSAATPLVT
ncbi:hypothetical protein RDV64_05595 [Acuticoccus sp. MNP-M23]|uniref:hypothetical protein n=1 Tax=Acuticoccus sp. MNP-M23 TaxID=3072793 RepID=UPI002814EBAE|nr:hypothetical protein [Acuticoccus sp. MNP-M23]WMS43868.1 hypothetical protein RDV64_05595 [Acuticoccus sp. MNP-M23]